MLDGNDKRLSSSQNCFQCGTPERVSEQGEVLCTHSSNHKQFNIALSCFIQYHWPRGFTVVHRLPQRVVNNTKSTFCRFTSSGMLRLYRRSDGPQRLSREVQAVREDSAMSQKV